MSDNYYYDLFKKEEQEERMQEIVLETLQKILRSPSFRVSLRQMIEDALRAYPISLELQNTVIEVVEKALYGAMHLKMQIYY